MNGLSAINTPLPEQTPESMALINKARVEMVKTGK